MRLGFSLFEIVVILALLALVTGMALPRAGHTLDGLVARQAAERIVLAHARARAVALVEQRVTLVTVTPDSLVVVVGDSARWRLPGPGATGAVLEGGGAPVAYAPNGLAMGAANARYVVRRRSVGFEVLVSRLGRVRVLRIAP